MSYRAYVLDHGSNLWQIWRAPDNQVEYDIQGMLSRELDHLEASIPAPIQLPPVLHILWARGMRPGMWPLENPGPMPGELCIAFIDLTGKLHRFQLIPIPAINKSTQKMAVRWVGPRQHGVQCRR